MIRLLDFSVLAIELCEHFRLNYVVVVLWILHLLTLGTALVFALGHRIVVFLLFLH